MDGVGSSQLYRSHIFTAVIMHIRCCHDCLLIYLSSQALQIPIATHYFYNFAIALNDMENHQTQTEYEDNLVLKTLFFQLFNNYGALTFTAFFKQGH
jgi:hypothetical protein